MCEFVSGVVTDRGDILFGDLYSHGGIEEGWNLRPDSYREFEWTGETRGALDVRGYPGEDSGYYKELILARYPTRSAMLADATEGRKGICVLDLQAIIAFTQEVKVFNASLWGMEFLQPQLPEDWMIVREYKNLQALSRALRDVVHYTDTRFLRLRAAGAVYSRGTDAGLSSVICQLRWGLPERAICVALGAAASRLVGRSGSSAEYNLVVHAYTNARDYILCLGAAKLGVDATWLYRWWHAWELGYVPIREKNDKLVVGRVVDAP